MKVYEYKPQLKPFGELGLGETFRYNGSYYIKAGMASPKTYAVCLTSGIIESLAYNDYVEPIKLCAEAEEED